jgi:uncharacterized membrane protein YsdA (DUF1294 family)
MIVRLVLFFLVMNALTYAAFALDKQRARARLYRISERTLLMLALLGGTPSAFLAQQRLRHKTHKEPFRTRLLLIAFAQLAGLTALMVPAVRDAVGGALMTLR